MLKFKEQFNKYKNTQNNEHWFSAAEEFLFPVKAGSFVSRPPSHQDGEQSQKKSASDPARKDERGNEQVGIDPGNDSRRNKSQKGKPYPPPAFLGHSQSICQEIQKTERDSQKGSGDRKEGKSLPDSCDCIGRHMIF